MCNINVIKSSKIFAATLRVSVPCTMLGNTETITFDVVGACDGRVLLHNE